MMAKVSRGSGCPSCFSTEICICDICVCKHTHIGPYCVCPDKCHLFLKRKSGKGSMMQSIVNRECIRLETSVVCLSGISLFSDELTRLREQVARLTKENEELKCGRTTERKAATDT